MPESERGRARLSLSSSRLHDDDWRSWVGVTNEAQKVAQTHRQTYTHMHTHARLQVRHSTTPHTHTLFFFYSLCLCLCALSRSLPVDSIERERGRANGKHCAIGEILGGTLALQLAIKRQAASTLQAPRSASQLNRNQKTENSLRTSHTTNEQYINVIFFFFNRNNNNSNRS